MRRIWGISRNAAVTREVTRRSAWTSSPHTARTAPNALMLACLPSWPCGRVGATLSDLQDFAGMCDADAELEFDGAPDTQEQVTTPPEVYAR